MGCNISSENLNNLLLRVLLKELSSFFGNINVDFYVIGATKCWLVWNQCLMNGVNN
jgi:hypothetical protein